MADVNRDDPRDDPNSTLSQITAFRDAMQAFVVTFLDSLGVGRLIAWLNRRA